MKTALVIALAILALHALPGCANAPGQPDFATRAFMAGQMIQATQPAPPIVIHCLGCR